MTAVAPPFKHDLFISFSHHDKEFAQAVYEQLQALRLDVFFSDETLRNELGTAFGFKIQDGLAGSQHFLLVVSDDAFESKWVNTEWMTFFGSYHMEEPEQRRFFRFPIVGFDLKKRPPFLLGRLPAKPVQDIIDSIRPTKRSPRPDLASDVAQQLEQIDAPDTPALMRGLAATLDGLCRSNDTERGVFAMASSSESFTRGGAKIR